MNDPTKEKETLELKELGNVAFKQKQYTEAISYYTKAIELSPNLSVLYCNRSLTFINLSQFEEGLADAEKTIELDPSNVKGYFRKGECLINLKQFNEAEKSFSKGLELESKFQPQQFASQLEIFLGISQFFQRNMNVDARLLQQLSFKKIYDIVQQNLNILKLESFARQVCAVSINLGNQIKLRRLILVDPFGRISDSEIPLIPGTVEVRNLQKDLEEGKRNLGCLFLYIKKDPANSGKQTYYIEEGTHKTFKSSSFSPLQKEILLLTVTEANNVPFFNEYISKLLKY